MKNVWAIDMNKGGNAITYHQEDPAIRRGFEEALAREGAVSHMESRLYERPDVDAVHGAAQLNPAGDETC
jgi:hypothetical protein